jgi:tRNA(adenine34) deaminase
MELSVYSDEHFMKLALEEAKLASEEGEIPVGCVIVSGNRVIAKAHNQVERLMDATAHAEMVALTSAQNYMGSKYLEDCKVYVTLEPCTMCAGAFFWAQIGQLFVGASDPDRGFSRLRPKVLHPKTEVVFGLLSEESTNLIKDFFAKLRDRS